MTSRNGVIGWLVAACAFVAYVATMGEGPSPGQSIGSLVTASGLQPLLTPLNPFAVSFMGWLARLPVGTMSFRVTLASAVFGALSVGLLYRLVSGAVRLCTSSGVEKAGKDSPASILAGLGASLFLAFCIPFWIVSNRAHVAALDTLWLLVAATLLLAYVRTGKIGFAYAFVLACGLGMVELATFSAFIPLCGLYLVYQLWRHEQLNGRTVAGILLVGLAGCLAYFIVAWRFYDSPGYHLREYTGGYWQVLWHFWRDQYLLMTQSLPQTGWLLVLIVSVAPWLAALLVAKRSLNGEKDWTYYVLHAVMTMIAVGILFNMKLSPLRLTGTARLLVTPYVLMACVYGYLVAYWFLTPSLWFEDSQNESLQKLGHVIGPLFAAVLLGMAVVAPVRNAVEADAGVSNPINRYAREVVRSLAGRDWLITSGGEDSHIAIAAADAGLKLNIINLSGQNNEVYMNYVGSLFDEPRYRNLAGIGLFPLLQEWFRSDTNIASKLAITSLPDLLGGSGLVAEPNKMVFLAVRDARTLDMAALKRDHERFWSERLPALLEMGSGGGDAGSPMFMRHVLARHAGMVANNLGVLLEEAALTNDAQSVYREALSIDPENLSALLNAAALLDAGVSTPEPESKEIRDRVSELARAESLRPDVWSLSRVYGYVRQPEVYLKRGWMWVLSGQPGLALSGMKKALDMSPENVREPLGEALADIMLMRAQDEAGASLYQELLAENPDNTKALLGLARVAIRQGRHKEAEDYLARAKKAGLPAKDSGVERAALLLIRGRPAEARIMLQELLDMEPSNLRAMVLLAEVLLAQNDQIGLAECLNRMERLGDRTGQVEIFKGRLAWRQGDWKTATICFQQALALKPSNSQVLEWLLRLDLLQRRIESAHQHARQLLRISPDNGLGNYVMGSLYIHRGDLDLAEAALLRSLETKREPLALNDLAWLLQKKGDLARAESAVREAIAGNAKMNQAWDTLGVILLKQGKLEEAEKAIRQSLSIFQGSPEVFLHLAQLLVRTDRNAEADGMADMLISRRNQLSFDAQRELDDLLRQLGRRL